MRCPNCRARRNRVVDSRLSGDGSSIRRRRVCSACQHRFTTYERVEQTSPMVVKKDNRREPYDRDKIVGGLTKACEKRPVSTETIAAIADRIETAIAERGGSEVPSSFLGSAVMNDMFNGAEGWLEMWERAYGVRPASCIRRSARVRRRSTFTAVLTALGQPSSRSGRASRYCVRCPLRPSRGPPCAGSRRRRWAPCRARR